MLCPGSTVVGKSADSSTPYGHSSHAALGLDKSLGSKPFA